MVSAYWVLSMWRFCCGVRQQSQLLGRGICWKLWSRKPASILPALAVPDMLSVAWEEVIIVVPPPPSSPSCVPVVYHPVLGSEQSWARELHLHRNLHMVWCFIAVFMALILKQGILHFKKDFFIVWEFHTAYDVFWLNLLPCFYFILI